MLIIVQSQEAKKGYLYIFFNMKVYCVFAIESPHRGDSNEYTQYTIFNMKTKNTQNYSKPVVMGFKNEFETALVNEPSVFEPLKIYCILLLSKKLNSLVSSMQLNIHKIPMEGKLYRP